MKHGWKTRIDERQYFEAKLSARMERVISHDPSATDS